MGREWMEEATDALTNMHVISGSNARFKVVDGEHGPLTAVVIDGEVVRYLGSYRLACEMLDSVRYLIDDLSSAQASSVLRIALEYLDPPASMGLDDLIDHHQAMLYALEQARDELVDREAEAEREGARMEAGRSDLRNEYEPE